MASRAIVASLVSGIVLSTISLSSPADELPNTQSNVKIADIGANETYDTVTSSDAGDSGASSGNSITVLGQKETLIKASKEKLDKIPGTVSVIDNAQVEQGRDSNLEDVLSFQPGILAQSTSGTEANKVSIRGSGLNAFYGGYSLGITYLINGIPFTGAAGTQEDLLSTHAVNATEVLYGANAFDYSSTALGGAINFITDNGYTSPGFYIRAEAGSFGYQKEQVSYGGVSGGTDYYLSFQHNFRSGYQDDTTLHGNDVFLNVGHKFSDQLESRFFVRYRREDYINGSSLTLGQIENSPTTNSYHWLRTKPGTTLFGSNTAYTFADNSRLEFNLGVDNFPLVHGIPGVFWQRYQSTDVEGSLRYLRKDQLFGRSSDTTLTAGIVDLVHSGEQRSNGSDLPINQSYKNNGSRNLVFSAGNDLQVLGEGHLTTGFSLINVVRDIRTVYNVVPNITQFPSNFNYRTWELAPRLGFRYQLTPQVQVFANGSRSVDPPVTWQYTGGAANLFPLRVQTANSAEIGVRGGNDVLQGSLTLYRAWVHGELLTTTLVPATATSEALITTTNASPTIHQGVEAGLDAKLWRNEQGDKLSLRNAFTFNDFYYAHDSAFGDAQLPGIPRWVYQGALQYDDFHGFYLNANVRVASSYYVDYANTYKAPFYAITGAKVGYEAPGRRWTVFIEGKNLTDRRYVSAAGTAFDLHGATDGATTALFYPGDGRSVYAGFSWRQ